VALRTYARLAGQLGLQLRDARPSSGELDLMVRTGADVEGLASVVGLLNGTDWGG
jgi:hypothetical protein